MNVNSQPQTNLTRLFTDFDLKLWCWFSRAEFVIARSRDLELSQFELTGEQSSILYELIIRGGSATSAEIADVTMRQHHSVSALINRMVERGLVEKKKTNSRNKYIVTITDEGRRIYSTITFNSLKMGFSDLTEKDKEKLASYLQTILNRGRKMLGIDFKLPFLASSEETTKNDVI